MASGDEMTFMLWDTAGQEEYDAITRSYYKGSGGALIVFSTVDRASFDAVESWYHKITSECGKSAVTILIQNKIDLISDSVVSDEEVELLAKRLGIRLHRTCVKENRNVEEVFRYVGEEYLKRGGEASLTSRPVVDLNDLSVCPIGRETRVHTDKADAAVVADARQDADSDSRSAEIASGVSGYRPAVRRTDGKKKTFSFINCSVF